MDGDDYAMNDATNYVTTSPFLNALKDRINLRHIPFSDRGSRLMVFRQNDHLQVRLAERWFKLDHQLSSYRNALPFTATTYPHCIIFHTAVGDYWLVFVDQETLLLTLPPGTHGLRFRADLDAVRLDRRGGVIRRAGEIRRNIAFTTNARLVTQQATPDGASHIVEMTFACADECGLLLNITPRLGFNRHIPAPGAVLAAAEQRWDAWFAAAPVVAERYRAQYYYAWWVMRIGLISSRFYTTREAMTPSKIHYVGVWQWDAFFHALAYRHVEPKLAQDQLRIVLDHQREDGMIPDAIHDEGIVDRLTFPVEADVTKPPLLAWSAWKLYEMDGDREFLDEIYEPIVRWNRWWFERNDIDGNGLCEYQHPFSSGLDDSPLWDDGVPVEAPDLNTYLTQQMEALAKIADVIGEHADAVMWRARTAELAQRMIDHMWDEQAGLFWATHQGKRVAVRTPFNLFPLITGRMPAPIVQRLLSHLRDPQQFWSRYPVPTVALDDPKFDPLQMWRGPTWVNINYLLVEGLQRIGQDELATELRRRTLDMMLLSDDIYEYYHPETGEIPPQSAPLYGWSAAVFIEMAIAESRYGEQE